LLSEIGGIKVPQTQEEIMEPSKSQEQPKEQPEETINVEKQELEKEEEVSKSGKRSITDLDD